MFTGIISEVGIILGKKVSNKTNLVISKPVSFKIELGDSVSCNGVCLTVSDLTVKSFSVDLMDETLKKTALGDLNKGNGINLEPASRVGDKLDGHIVQGHIDTFGLIMNLDKNGNDTVVTIDIPQKFNSLLVEKGSICIEGISLTVFDVKQAKFSVSLVSYTLKNTTAKNWKIGQKLNLEFDIIGKYVAKMLKDRH